MSTPAVSPRVPAGLYDRLHGLLSPAFHTKRVAVLGVGAGSYLVEKLARLGPAALLIADLDRVEITNLVRTNYELADVGELKVQALGRRLARVAPSVAVTAVSTDLSALAHEAAHSVIGAVDLLIHGTDKFQVAAWANQYAVREHIPAVFIGVHARGEGGRVIWTRPPETPCYRCLAAQRYAEDDHGGVEATDLDRAPALLPDIQLIDTVALKVVLALLERGQDSAMGRFCAAMQGRPDIVVRCHPEYAWGGKLWHALLGPEAEEVSPYLVGMDSVWMEAVKDPDCPACGTARG